MVLDSPVSEEDRQDIAAATDGDEGAFTRLVTRYQPAVSRQMFRFSRDAEVHQELVHEVFVEVFMSLKSFRGQAPFLNWVRRIATRVGYRYWSRRERQQRIRREVGEHHVRMLESADSHGPSEAANCLFDLLASLGAKDRLVLTLHYFDGCSTLEVAERVGWSHTLVRVRMHRARRRLRRLLNEAGFGRKGNDGTTR